MEDIVFMHKCIYNPSVDIEAISTQAYYYLIKPDRFLIIKTLIITDRIIYNIIYHTTTLLAFFFNKVATFGAAIVVPYHSIGLHLHVMSIRIRFYVWFLLCVAHNCQVYNKVAAL